MKLGLGTAQWGMDYGIANKSGCVSESEVRSILNIATLAGVSYLDTAPAYGNSETVIGKTLPHDAQFKIISKTPATETDDLEKDIKNSLSHLGCQTLYGFLVHDVQHLLDKNGVKLWATLEKFKERGLVKHLGVSVYDGNQIDQLWPKFNIDLIQVPLSVFDQRLIHSGHLNKLKAAGVEVHVRSAFLQGSMLMSLQDLPEFFNPFKHHFVNWQIRCREIGISKIQAALGFLSSHDVVDSIICGIDNAKHFEELVDAVSTTIDPHNFYDLANTDPALLNPSRWN